MKQGERRQILVKWWLKGQVYHLKIQASSMIRMKDPIRKS